MLKKLLALLIVPILGCAASPEKVYTHTKDKVVKIGMILDKANKEGKLEHWKGSCSGAFISHSGLVLTCAHCFSDPGITKIFIKTDDGRVSQGFVLKIDTKQDLALVQSFFLYTPYFDLGKEVIRGQKVMSFGSSLGMQHTMTVGYVSNLSTDGLQYIFHTAFILPGNSGGPLVDEHGHLVGVNEANLMLNFLVPAAGYYLAIDLPVVKAFLGIK